MELHERVTRFNSGEGEPKLLVNDLWDEIARLRADMKDRTDGWANGMAFVASCLGESRPVNLSAVRIGEAVLALRAMNSELLGPLKEFVNNCDCPVNEPGMHNTYCERARAAITKAERATAEEK